MINRGTAFLNFEYLCQTSWMCLFAV